MCLLVVSRNLLCLRAWLILQDIISFTNINTVSAGPGLRSLSMIPRPGLSLVQPPPSRALSLVETGHVTQILASHWSRAPDRGLIGSRRASSAVSLYGAVIWRHNAPWARLLTSPDVPRSGGGGGGQQGPVSSHFTWLRGSDQERSSSSPESLGPRLAIEVYFSSQTTSAIRHGNKYKVISRDNI